MTYKHPIIPPQEKVDQWGEEWHHSKISDTVDLDTYLANQAGQWCADRELEACELWLTANGYNVTAARLRAARRPKPPSLKEQALALLQPGEPRLFNSEMQDTIRHALEALPND